MARTAINTIELQLPLRGGAAAEIAALTPFPTRLRADAWMFNRRPFSHDTPIAAGGRLGKIYLGETPEEPEPGVIPGAPTTAPIARTTTTTPRTTTTTPRETTPSLRAVPSGDTPQQLSYSLSLNHVTGSTEKYAAVSTPALPWPCRIVGATLTRWGADASQVMGWNVCATSVPYDGYLVTPPPGRLIEPRNNIIESGQPSASLSTWGPITSDAAAGGVLTSTTHLLGATVGAAGQYLVFVLYHPTSDIPIGGQLTLTVQELTGAASGLARVTPPMVTPRVPAPVPLAPRVTIAPPEPIPTTPAPVVLGIAPTTSPLQPATTPARRPVTPAPQAQFAAQAGTIFPARTYYRMGVGQITVWGVTTMPGREFASQEEAAIALQVQQAQLLTGAARAAAMQQAAINASALQPGTGVTPTPASVLLSTGPRIGQSYITPFG